MNRYPLWKNLLVVVVTLVALVYALPNVFDQDPSMEITGSRRAQVTEATVEKVKTALEEAGVPFKGVELDQGRMLVRFETSGAQLEAKDAVAVALGPDYNQALTLATDVPGWLRAIDAEPMYLGLDLRGGIHVVIDVDMDAAVEQSIDRYTGDIRTALRKEKVRYGLVSRTPSGVLVKFDSAEVRDRGAEVVRSEFRNL